MGEVVREELAWAGGLFEGEGSFSWKRNPSSRWPCPQAAIDMTDPEPIVRFARAVGIGSTYGPYERAGKPGHRWHVDGFERFQAVVAMLWPWLSERRRSRAADILREMR